MASDFVFLHGGGQASWVWAETLAAMALQAGASCGRLVTLDVPGCGTKRGQTTDGVSVPDIVASLIEDIEAADLDRPVLVGHSQAGTILPRLLRSRPQLFRHTVYVSCLAPASSQTALSWRTEMPDDGSALPKAMAAGSRESYRWMFCNDMAADDADAVSRQARQRHVAGVQLHDGGLGL